jgi:hypothetical protein
MRVRRRSALLSLALLALCAGSALPACFDLLHSTADVLTACEIDASHPGCSTASKGETDFCAFGHDEARRHALHACAWLGACESPIGNNAFGACYFRALMAYDCAANPDHPVRGRAHALWDCLQQVTTCGDVDTCVFGDTPRTHCGTVGTYTSCAEGDPEVRVLCTDGGVAPYARAAGSENCAMWGQRCAAGGGGCSIDPTTLDCVPGCDPSGALHWCVAEADGGSAVDRGIDCATNGAMSCGGFPTAQEALWVACRPQSDGAACTPDASAVCGSDGRAVMCPSGVRETLDCATLMGSTLACTAGALSPPFDWTSPCSRSPSACVTDSCDGDELTSCERGAAFRVSCAAQHLGDCRMVTVEPGAAPRAACGPPLP